MLVLACVLGPSLLPFDDPAHRHAARFAPPLDGRAHLFGTDPLGRDLAARLLWRAASRSPVGFAAMVISTVVGTVIGVVAGYYGGRVRAVLMRFVDAMLCFPRRLPAAGPRRLLKPDPLTYHPHHRGDAAGWRWRAWSTARSAPCASATSPWRPNDRRL